MNFNQKFQSFIDVFNNLNNSNHNALEYVKLINNTDSTNNNNNNNIDDGLSFKNLNLYSNYLSNYLIENVITNNDSNSNNIIIGVYQNHSFQLIISILSIFKINQIYLPLDTSYPTERLSYMLNHSNCNIIITTHQYHNNNEIYNNKKIICIDCLFKNNTFNNNNNNNFSNYKSIKLLNNYQIKENDKAYLVYTSGSSGNPKGVLVSHSGIVTFLKHQIAAFKFNVAKKTRLLQSLPICFDASLSEIGTSLLSESTLLIPKSTSDSQLIRGSSVSFLQHITSNGITATMISPSFLSLLSIDSFNPDTSTLETIVIGGEKCPLQVLKNWRKKLNIINVYGPTEVTVCTTTNLIYKRQSNSDGNDNEDLELISLGDLVPNLKMYLLDEQTKLPIKEIGGQGEIYISGAGVAIEYFKNEKQTQDSFLIDHFNGGDGKTRMFKTGDWGKLIGINLKTGKDLIEFRGRMDNQIKLNGTRIELDEISKTLENHYLVHQAVCDVKTLDNGIDKALIAYLILNDKPIHCTNKSLEISNNSTSLSKLLKQFLLKSLPSSYCPNYFMILKSFPLNSNEKIDKFKLPIPKMLTNGSSDDNGSGRNEFELDFINLVANILMVDSTMIGLNDNLIELGMTSIHCVQIIEKSRLNLGLIISVYNIYNLKTIGNILNYLNNGNGNNNDDDGSSSDDFGKKSIGDLKSFLLNYNSSSSNIKYSNIVDRVDKADSNSNNNNNINCKNIFITGSTGFIGSSLFKRIYFNDEYKDYKFYLLVRSIDKLNVLLENIGISNSSRVIGLVGDIGLVRFGLSEQEYSKLCNEFKISMIIHCAARVDMNLPFDEMIKDNIKSMYYLLDFINEINSSTLKKVHYISTLSTVLSNSKYWSSITDNDDIDNQPIDLNQPLLNDNENDFIFGGYAQSKWLSEYLISNVSSSLNDKLVIHRPALICPDKESDKLFKYSNYLNKLMDTCRNLKSFPILPNSIRTDITSIGNLVDNFILNISDNGTIGGGNIGPKCFSYYTSSISLSSLFESEFTIDQGKELKNWITTISTTHSFYPFIQFLNNVDQFEKILFPAKKLLSTLYSGC